jgi:hypothetical protein
MSSHAAFVATVVLDNSDGNAGYAQLLTFLFDLLLNLCELPGEIRRLARGGDKRHGEKKE